MQRTVRIETNNQVVLQLAQKFFERYQHGHRREPEFIWRIVSEPNSGVNSTAVNLSAFSAYGVRFLNVGQRGFLAVDVEQRKATGYLAELFFEADARLRHRPPLDVLLCMTAASLRLTALSGACVGIEDRAALIFGPPNSGKTTSSYLAARMGMKFHADQVVFLDMEKGTLRAWGDPFPAVFRPETLQFLPELGSATHFSTYSDLTFHYFDKGAFQSRWAEPVLPMYNIFLDRRAGCESELREITQHEVLSRLRESVLFEEDSRFDSQILAAIWELSKKPSFALRYDSDPMIAANIIDRMLR